MRVPLHQRVWQDDRVCQSHGDGCPCQGEDKTGELAGEALESLIRSCMPTGYKRSNTRYSSYPAMYIGGVDKDDSKLPQPLQNFVQRADSLTAGDGFCAKHVPSAFAGMLQTIIADMMSEDSSFSQMSPKLYHIMERNNRRFVETIDRISCQYDCTGIFSKLPNGGPKNLNQCIYEACKLPKKGLSSGVPARKGALPPLKVKRL